MAIHNGPVSNAFVINDLRIMASVAEHLGKTGDAERYRTQQKASTEAYVSAFVSEDGSMRVDYQGVYVMALALVLPKGDLWNSVFAKLVGKLKTEGMQTGFFATQHLLCPSLQRTGRRPLSLTSCSRRTAPAGCTR